MVPHAGTVPTIQASANPTNHLKIRVTIRMSSSNAENTSRPTAFPRRAGFHLCTRLLAGLELICQKLSRVM
jgi:hypothetical protein